MKAGRPTSSSKSKTIQISVEPPVALWRGLDSVEPMSALIVHNARHPIPVGYTAIYVGRKSTYQPAFGADFSILGNPFPIGKNGSRPEVIALYRQWLQTRLRVSVGGKVSYPDTPQSRAVQALVERVEAGEHLALICWCAPLACHADVIKTELELASKATRR
ncbi:MAG: hypothetical protein JWQ08_467 [Deinococcus sp.]|nr:hypothetical protein [Deinococcus sp.]